MTDSHELSIQDLEIERAELLPGREALGTFRFNTASLLASNSSLALNAATFDSFATSSAGQTILVSQG